MNEIIAQQTVAHGTRLLDRVWPGWEQQIQLPRLDVASPTDCVLGQLFGTFSTGARRLRVPLTVYGFDVPPGYNRAEGHALLTQAWREAIAARRARTFQPDLEPRGALTVSR